MLLQKHILLCVSLGLSISTVQSSWDTICARSTFELFRFKKVAVWNGVGKFEERRDDSLCKLFCTESAFRYKILIGLSADMCLIPMHDSDYDMFTHGVEYDLLDTTDQSPEAYGQMVEGNILDRRRGTYKAVKLFYMGCRCRLLLTMSRQHADDFMGRTSQCSTAAVLKRFSVDEWQAHVFEEEFKHERQCSKSQPMDHDPSLIYHKIKYPYADLDWWQYKTHVILAICLAINAVAVQRSLGPAVILPHQRWMPHGPGGPVYQMMTIQ